MCLAIHPLLVLHLEHLDYRILQQTHVVVDQYPLVDSASFAHQADQREMASLCQYHFTQVKFGRGITYSVISRA